jgi:hypothetical protein
MSTIATQMNWGASYLVNDVWRRFLVKNATERQAVRASRIASGIVLMLGGVAAWILIVRGVSVDDAWAFLAALGAGVGSVFVLRWFWWRINAWSEIAAMLGSFVAFLGTKLWRDEMPEAERLRPEYTSLLVAVVTLVVWLAATFATKPEPMAHLQAFYRKVRPDGPGWGPVAKATPDVRPDGTLARGILCAVVGTTVVWLTLPGIGAVIFGDYGRAAACLGGAALAAVVLFAVVPRTAATPVSTG